MRRGSSDPSALFPLQPCARRDECIVARAIREGVVAAIAGDRTVNEARIVLAKFGVVDAECFCATRRITIDHDVGACGEGQKGGFVFGVLEVEDGAALPPVPGFVSGLIAKRVFTGRFDAHHVSPVINEQHRGHGASDSAREVQNEKAVEYACHVHHLRRKASCLPC